MTIKTERIPPPADAAALVRIIAGDGPVSFRTLDDTKSKGEEPNSALVRAVLYGPLEDAAPNLLMLNAKGAGIFFLPQETEYKPGGRGGFKDKHVTRIRTVMLDLDGSPLDPVLTCGLEPHAITETSQGRYHVYWRVRDFPLDMFRAVQKAIARRFSGDPSICHPGRIMRLPGFANNKSGKGRFVGRIKDLRADVPPYGLRAILQHLAPDLAPPELKQAVVRTYEDDIPLGRRNAELWKRAQGFLISGIVGEGPLLQRLLTINEQKCKPPLSYEEVKRIVISAMAQPPAGFAALPWALTDSPAWKKLPHPSRSIVTYAYRRYNGDPNAKIGLPWADFADEWPTPRVFYRWRRKAVTAGLLRKVEGRTWCPILKKNLPDFFVLVYLPETSRSKNKNAAQREPIVTNGPIPYRTKSDPLERSSASSSCSPDLRLLRSAAQNDEPENYAEADEQGAQEHGRLSAPVLEDFGASVALPPDLPLAFADADDGTTTEAA